MGKTNKKEVEGSDVPTPGFDPQMNVPLVSAELVLERTSGHIPDPEKVKEFNAAQPKPKIRPAPPLPIAKNLPTKFGYRGRR